MKSSGARPRLRSFHELMQRRVQRILLVSSLYDSFIMSEEGQLQESLLSQFLALNVSHFPDLLQVGSAAEALDLLDRDRDFDLVVASASTGDSDAGALANELAARGHPVPVIALAYEGAALKDFLARADTSHLERIFLWQGDVRILLAMVQYLEDRLNVAHDTGEMGVPAILVVEDNIRWYSSFLPVIYAEIFDHTHTLLSEGLNLSQKMLRMRARPKVLLRSSYETAWRDYERYEDQLLGVISDFEFPKEGELAKSAGIEFCTAVRARRSDVRLVMQSSRPEYRTEADKLGASFLLKGSPTLLHDLREILIERFGFGPFLFRGEAGEVIDQAGDLWTLAQKLRTVPATTIAYHAERNHFSNWLKARAEFTLAEKLRPQRIADFASLEELRAHLLQQVQEARLERNRTVIADFDRATFEPAVSITRIGGGSLGGKARGVAFANRILHDSDLRARFPDVDIRVPPAVVLGTAVYEAFLEYPELRDFALADHPDEKVRKRFVAASFPRSAVADLLAYVQSVRYPLAVRSSSLLEDSLSQPFAGVYRSYFLPNNDIDAEARWQQLAAAIKLVYASTFAQQAKGYLSMTSYRLEEEKMAVMVQELVGVQHGERFYPDFSGVARSHNYYPEPGQRAEDGVVAVALGLGRTVVEGRPCLRFSPRHKLKALGFSSLQDVLEHSQREFYALDLERSGIDPEHDRVARFQLEAAEQDGPLAWLGSTYLPNDNRVVEGIARAGVRLVSFAQVLKHDAFPLAQILAELLERCAAGTGSAVEIEFAGNLASKGRRGQLAFLQMRPMAAAREGEAVEIGKVDPREVLCQSKKVLGNGRIDDIHDLVVVDPERFDRAKSPEVALAVARFDALLKKERRPYLLVGVGRWGTADPHLGIPVEWSHIAGARVIVECGLRDLVVEPSQGTHFFQNLSSSNVGYFTVNEGVGEAHFDWAWIKRQRASAENGCVRHLRLAAPVVVKLDGKKGEGVILKPGA